MKHALGLNEWRVGVELCHIDDTFKANIEVQPEYRTALMRIDAEEHDDEAELVDTVRHELLHIFHAELGVLMDQVKPFVDTKVMESLFVSYRFVAEKTVSRLEDLLTHQLNASPERLVKLGTKAIDRFDEAGLRRS